MAQSNGKGLMDERLMKYAVRIINVSQALPKTFAGRHIAQQLLRCGTSPGANYREACGAESRADFAHKVGIALKELRETDYWLNVSAMSGLLTHKKLEPLLQETNELIAMSVSSVVTAKRGSENEKHS